ncbi:endodeoxyribonuclease RusA [Pusillimonas caeni]|uniref:endodeoxyribonuclease RusA n=1 Tax=Pusillimonas caeni TaxID=1348472 RepID=UPI000E59A435|nr:endodeoxyribonuclease RusA [Pusillimonas caeni]TFL14201.1 endodeoxyribonuclease RusA [Pusillimonas caeni]
MTLDRLTIILPWPDPALFPNAKGGKHWASFQAQKVRARQDGYFAAKQALGANTIALTERTPVNALFVFPDRRNRDIEGCIGAIKHHIDGVAQALGVDDKLFRPWTLDDALDAQGRGFVKVEIGQ